MKKGGASIPLLTEPANDRVFEMLEKTELKQQQVEDRSCRRTVSETKRYLQHIRQEGAALTVIGNHSLPPTPVSREVDKLLKQEDIMSTVPVFKLPKVGKPTDADEDAVWVVEFKDSAAAEKARSAELFIAGRQITFI